jgi:hypothetical protein
MSLLGSKAEACFRAVQPSQSAQPKPNVTGVLLRNLCDLGRPMRDSEVIARAQAQEDM